MAKYLVIVESPAKSENNKEISRCELRCGSSNGHVVISRRVSSELMLSMILNPNI